MSLTSGFCVSKLSLHTIAAHLWPRVSTRTLIQTPVARTLTSRCDNSLTAVLWVPAGPRARAGRGQPVHGAAAGVPAAQLQRRHGCRQALRARAAAAAEG